MSSNRFCCWSRYHAILVKMMLQKPSGKFRVGYRCVLYSNDRTQGTSPESRLLGGMSTVLVLPVCGERENTTTTPTLGLGLELQNRAAPHNSPFLFISAGPIAAPREGIEDVVLATRRLTGTDTRSIFARRSFQGI